MVDETDSWLLVSDVDDTLIGNFEAYCAFQEATSADPNLTLVLNSSRPVRSVLSTLEELEPRIEPTTIIGAMGTEIFENGEPIKEWTQRFDGWSRGPIDAVMASLGFEKHDAEFQTPFKASYAVPGEAEQERVVRSIRMLGDDFKVVASGESDFDILPPNADKGDATLFVADRLGFDADHIIVAGDSANDLSMFDVARRGIVVGNARGELVEAVDPGRAYFAQADRALGVVEGLIHYDALSQN